MSLLIQDGELVLFQGDSITDAGRDRTDPFSLGYGYPMMIDAWFSALYPAKHVRFANCGISGNRVKDLKARWDKDCIDLRPDWVSILIGINDCWRRYAGMIEMIQPLLKRLKLITGIFLSAPRRSWVQSS